MKKYFLIFLSFLIIFSGYCAELKYKDEWREPFDEYGYKYISTLCYDQVLGLGNDKKLTESGEEILFIKNYLTNEITCKFPPDYKLWCEEECYITDQYGQYIFFYEDNKVKLFDVESKKFRNTDDKLKRNRFVYYFSKDDDKNKYKLIKYDILSEKYSELTINTKTVNEKFLEIVKNFQSKRNYYAIDYKTIYEIDSQTLLLKNGFEFYYLKINESKTKILEIEQIDFVDNGKFKGAFYIDEDCFFAFDIHPYQSYVDEIKYEFMLLDNKGKICQTFSDVEFTGPIEGVGFYNPNNFCMISKNNKYFLFFDDFKIYIYQFTK